ncbi:MAG TPA: putative PEP-binding protein, partial [Armatimonadota bacterium]|nr:putative PEP-binding protein [Armatimonadota bacterium]
FGTMIEVPRAALTAGEIAKYAEFFSFGTNDLTQTVYAISRDDAGTIISEYVEKKIFPADPFQTLDQVGVGRLMQICIEDAKKVRPDIKLGICGEHGGDPDTVKFCDRIGLTYVSCSPYRVPIARLAAAQAQIKTDHSADK